MPDETAADATGVAREDLLREVDRLITALQAHPDPEVGQQLTALLEGIDTVHRTALTHLVGAVEAMAGQAFMNRLIADPAIRLLLMSYDLLAVDRRLLAEEALDAVRGHLHAHGIDIELLEVVGGVVYVRLHGLERSGHSEEAVLRDLETALREGLVGFQEVVSRPREAQGTFVQLGGVRRANKPVYRRIAASDDLREGQLLSVAAGEQPITLARVNGEIFAVSGTCADTPLPLTFSRLEGHVLECSWHGCRYDVRTGAFTGRRSAREGVVEDPASAAQRLAVYPVREEDGSILVAVAVEPAAS